MYRKSLNQLLLDLLVSISHLTIIANTRTHYDIGPDSDAVVAIQPCVVDVVVTDIVAIHRAKEQLVEWGERREESHCGQRLAAMAAHLVPTDISRKQRQLEARQGHLENVQRRQRKTYWKLLRSTSQSARSDSS